MYPHPASRETCVLAPGEARHCSYSSARPVESYSQECYLFLSPASIPRGTLYKLPYILSRTTELHLNAMEDGLVATTSDGAALAGEPAFIYDLNDSLGRATDSDAD